MSNGYTGRGLNVNTLGTSSQTGIHFNSTQIRASGTTYSQYWDAVDNGSGGTGYGIHMQIIQN